MMDRPSSTVEVPGPVDSVLLAITWMSNKIGSCFQVIDKVRKLSVIYGVNNL